MPTRTPVLDVFRPGIHSFCRFYFGLELRGISFVRGFDGRGFDATAIQADRARGLGLRGMRERLALVGGELTLDSQPGRGTYVRARVPLPDTRTDKRASE